MSKEQIGTNFTPVHTDSTMELLTFDHTSSWKTKKKKKKKSDFRRNRPIKNTEKSLSPVTVYRAAYPAGGHAAGDATPPSWGAGRAALAGAAGGRYAAVSSSAAPRQPHCGRRLVTSSDCCWHCTPSSCTSPAHAAAFVHKTPHSSRHSQSWSLITGKLISFHYHNHCKFLPC